MYLLTYQIIRCIKYIIFFDILIYWCTSKTNFSVGPTQGLESLLLKTLKTTSSILRVETLRITKLGIPHSVYKILRKDYFEFSDASFTV